MKAILGHFIFITLTVSVCAQISETFQDGNISADPVWAGDTSHFEIREGVLHLNAPEAGQSFLFTQTQQPHSWTFDLSLDFDPSMSNAVEVFLFLNRVEIDKASGHSLYLGDAGDADLIKLVEYKRGNRTVVAEGKMVHGAQPSLRLHIEREDSDWTLTSMEEDTLSFKVEFANIKSQPVTDTAGFFGILCTYTETRKDQFAFDNITVTNQFDPDTIPPKLLDIEISSPNQLILTCDESITEGSAEEVNNFAISPDIGIPKKAILLPDPTMIQLDLDGDLKPGVTYTIMIRNIADTDGNEANLTRDFHYSPPLAILPFDVLINEIYDDPTPSFGLPEAEYLELLIKKEGVNLDQIILEVGSKQVSLPGVQTQKEQYLVLTKNELVSSFSAGASIVGVDRFPTLVNGGNKIALLNTNGDVIHSISYDDAWYGSGSKADGGWSLEMINPEDPCALRNNWQASDHPSGGTPGNQNSIFNTAHVPEQGRILSSIPLDSLNLKVVLSKNHFGDVTSEDFLIDPEIEIESVNREKFNEVLLVLSSPLEAGIKYELIIHNLTDCTNQRFSDQPSNFILPKVAQPGDLVINEILFDPYPGGYDFVEIYNPTQFSFLVADLNILNAHTQRVTNLDQSYLMLPGSYTVFTQDASDLQRRYRVSNPDWIVETDLPGLSNDEGNVTIFSTRNGARVDIDVFDYSAGMHSTLLKDVEGISLERIITHGDTQDRFIWHSAAHGVGYATPTGENSQQFYEDPTDSWEILPKVFSPDGDGHDDLTLVTYDKVQAGSYVHIKIFDANGRLIKYLANNQSISGKGFVQWDGSTDLGIKAPIGIYTMIIQHFGVDGIVRTVKKTCVVAAKI